jgi:hypothetical protein
MCRAVFVKSATYRSMRYILVPFMAEQRNEPKMETILHVFRLITSKDLFTASTDRTGRNLPSSGLEGEWVHVCDIPFAQLSELVHNAKEARPALDEKGYFHLEPKHWKDKGFFARL